MGDSHSPTLRNVVGHAAARVWLAVAAGLAGAVLLFVGWWGVSGESLVALQLPYLASASIPGAALVIAAAIVWNGGSRRESEHDARPGARPDTWPDARVDALYALLTEPDAAMAPAADAAGDPSAAADHLVTVAGGTRYHRAGCLLVAGKLTETLTPETLASGEWAACPVCQAA